MGKDYLRRSLNVSKGDVYHTPFSCVWELLEQFKFKNCYDPAYGLGAIVKASDKYGVNFKKIGDITTGENFLEDLEEWDGDIFTNPPFSLFDKFVKHSKSIIKRDNENKICLLGKLNYLGCVGRSKGSVWNNLEWVLPFNRYVDFRTPYREDGLFYVAGQAMCWFIWNFDYNLDPKIRILNVQKYAALGGLVKDKLTGDYKDRGGNIIVRG